jgi:hypothetical protein
MGETLTNINKLRNPNYLGSWDFEDENGNLRDLIVTISKIEQGEAWESKSNSMKPVLTVHFAEGLKPIILNATNTKTIQDVTGSIHIEPMIGKKIQLTVKKVRMGRDMVNGIRIVNKLSSQLGTSQNITTTAPKPVDEADCITRLEKANTVALLAEIWTSLTVSEKANVTVLAKKEELKQKLSNPDANPS